MKRKGVTMQQTIQLDISSDIFDKVMSFMEQLLNLLPKNKVSIKEIKTAVAKPTDSYFSSETDKYIFALTELDGKNRQNILGINSLHYKDKELANRWKKNIATRIYSDRYTDPKAKKAWDKMMEIYDEMIRWWTVILYSIILKLFQANLRYLLDNSLIPLNETTKNSISNAWEEYAVFDEFGRVWIISDKIHILLRTSRENAKYIVGGISDNNKYRDGDILYIRGSEIYKILDETLQNARSFRRENYIWFSELFYRAIRDCDRGCLLRTAFYEHLNKTISSLKQKRIKVR